MNKITRILNILAGLAIIFISLFMFAFPDFGYIFATIILGCVLLLDGMKQLIYFFSMGIHMVGGKIILYRALITLDVGFFTVSIHGTGQRYIMFYFVMYYFFIGIVSIFRALEARRLEAGAWKMKLVQGLFDIMVTIICLFNNNSAGTMLDILCIALIISAVTRIGMALRKNAIIYIQ